MKQILIEVPEVLHDALQDYLAANPHRTLDDAIAMGLCLFLMQQRDDDPAVKAANHQYVRAIARQYLKTVFKKPEAN